MQGDADLASLGKLIGDRGRAAMLLVLLAGRPQSASALAEAAGISRSLASTHLRKLVDGGLLVVEQVGRHRLYRLANAVADALEGLLLLAPPQEVRSLRQAQQGAGLRRARLCYDHLAGLIGVEVYDAMHERGLLEMRGTRSAITAHGVEQLSGFGVDVATLERRSRPLARACMDWSERRNHLAGSLGAAMMSRLIDLRWVRVLEASRVVIVTAAGTRGLSDWLGVQA